eukprot:Lankesteria_metandrocarpae@DN3411_c0_g1_i1.p1
MNMNIILWALLWAQQCRLCSAPRSALRSALRTAPGSAPLARVVEAKLLTSWGRGFYETDGQEILDAHFRGRYVSEPSEWRVEPPEGVKIFMYVLRRRPDGKEKWYRLTPVNKGSMESWALQWNLKQSVHSVPKRIANYLHAMTASVAPGAPPFVLRLDLHRHGLPYAFLTNLYYRGQPLRKLDVPAPPAYSIFSSAPGGPPVDFSSALEGPPVYSSSDPEGPPVYSSSDPEGPPVYSSRGQSLRKLDVPTQASLKDQLADSRSAPKGRPPVYSS